MTRRTANDALALKDYLEKRLEKQIGDSRRVLPTALSRGTVLECVCNALTAAGYSRSLPPSWVDQFISHHLLGLHGLAALL
jgi:hypothetical protein